ncbi:hypothetical protein JYU20_04150, partial [Bacteroidales bacterium AH-315-I05]|nr:hypothetical protein [Bacteroidales bacterium AH-315-I05]
MVHFYKHVSFLLALLSVLSAFSQKTYYKKQASTTESCATHTIHNKLIQTDPTYKANYLAAEKQFQKALKSVTANTKLPVYSVPVVVHVIHLGEAVGTGTNISDAQIQSAITAINDDFRKKTGTNGDGAGVDSEIEFCLAVRDPSGNATTGINRVNGSGVALYSTEGITAGQGQGAIEVDVKALSRWPNTDYYNIWIVNEIENNNGGGGIQGYAYYPGASSLVDGSVIMYNAFGTVGNLKSYTDRNRVATHELGHGFNLRHTFNATTGCTSETNCNTQGDQCCDTPPHPGNNTSCFTPECSSTQQVANYMDYTGEDCQDMFSQNQSDRMRATFSSTRASLLSSQGCVPVASGANSNLKLIAGGQWHSVTLCSDSTVWATGYNANGQLGDGTTTNRLTPVQVTGIASVIGITASGHNSFALKNDSTLWAWGGNNYGSLGDGTTTSRTTPVQVTGLSKIISIEAGVTHTLALKNDGTVWAWGENSFGQLGDGTTVNKSAPIQVSGLTNMVAVAAAYLYSVALKNDGTVWAWGRNTGGTLGNGTNTDSYVPVQTSISNVSKISVYGAHVLALKNDGTVWTWGWNNLGQLGDGTTTDSNIPVQASGLTNIIEVAAGNQHSMALKNDSTVWAWGINTDGQLGIGNVPLNSTVPIQVTGISGVVDIAAGNSFSIVQRPTGDVYTWGINDYGELGDNTTTDRYTPVQMQLGCAVGFGICGISTTITTTNTTCNGGTDGSANLTPSDGAIPYSYSWSNGATTQDLSGIAAGTYYVTVTDNNSCTKVDSAVISEPAGLSLSLNTTSATCVSCTDGSIDLTVSGGTTPYTYSWSNSAITEDISGLTPSMYYVTVTDNNSCTAIDSALVDSCAGVSISVSSTNATCNGCTDGTTSVITPQSNKFKPYTPTSNYNTFYGGYNLSYINDSNFTNGTIWGSGTPDPYELTMTFTTAVKLDTVKVKGGQFNGNFNIPIEMKLYRGTSGGTLLTTINPTYTLDKYGFSNTVGSTVYTWVIRPAANGYASIREIQCFETPPNNTYTYQWNDAGNQTTTTATGLGAGTYHVTVTDQNSCTATDSATVTEPAPCLLTLSLSSTNATCNGSNDGTIDLTPSSGTTPYAYSWSNGAVTQDISGLTAGTYYVTVTDNNSCTKVDNATITEPAAISLSLTATNASCNGCTDGSVDLTATNGVAPYTYSWSNGAATQ